MIDLHLPQTRASKILGCRLPLILAGMGGVSRCELVTAVSRAGSFGFLGMVREQPTLIEREVEAVREAGVECFGVNIIPAATGKALLERQIDAIIALQVPVVCLFWDLDGRVVARLRDAGIAVVYQVGSADEAIAAERAGADIIIAQGIEAGGHVRGASSLRRLLPAVVKAVQVPVLAAGGLATGSDLVAAMALGAEGIVLGTALIATDESFAHDFHKQCLVAADGTDTVLTRAFHINWPSGAAVRVLKSAVTNDGTPHVSAQRIVIGEEDGRPIYLFSTDSPLRSMTGDLASMPLYAGTGAGHIHTIEPAKARIEYIVGEANGILAKATSAPIEELTSAVCYVGEFSGAYTGTLDAHELNAELKVLGLELQSLLVHAELEGRSGALPDVAWTPWILALRQQVPDWSYPTRGATSFEALLERLTRLLPRMAEGAARQSLFELRTVLEREIARAQVPPSV